MEIKLISAQTTFEAAKLTLKQIDPKNMDFQNLVVVPDAFSMQAESLIFDTLGIKSTFNIEIVGISRLASKILRDKNVPFSRVSSLEEIFCLYNAVQTCKKDFQYFKSCGVEFCQQVLKIVKQFKACKISPEQIKEVGDENLDKKMHDLRIVFEEYENCLGEKLDLSRLLEFFVSKAANELDLSKINLFFVNFDSFSAEIGSFIVRLAQKVNKTFVGMAQPKKTQKNAYIYEDDIKQKVQGFAKELGVVVPVEQNLNTLSLVHKDMAENVFGFDIKQGKSDFFFNIIPKNRQEEVEFVAKMIRMELTRGKRFKDFAVAVPNEQYFKTIKEVFSSFEIAHYCDDAANLAETVLGHFLEKIFEIAKREFVLQDFEFFATSSLLGWDEEVLKEVDFKQIDTSSEFVAAFPKYENLVCAIQELKKAQKLPEFVKIIENILEILKKQFENFLQKLEDEKYFKSQSENSQSWNLLKSVLEKLEEMGKNMQIDLQNFETLFVFALKSVKVETIPAYFDAVFVGLATESYFENVDTLFVLGANAGAMPALQADVGIVDDNDIKKLRLNFALEPEIRVLNRRKRLKIFELLQHPQKRLFVCTPLNETGAHQEAADFVCDLCTLFGQNKIHTSAFETFDFPVFSSEQELERILFEVGNRKNLMQIYTKLKEEIPKKYVSAFKNAIKEDLPVEKKIEKLENSHFPYKNTISVSELETYFSCPFKHFLRYGMKLQEKKNILPQKSNFGSFVHELLKHFVENQELGSLTERDVESFLQENFGNIVKKYYDEKILKQTQFVKYLKNESRLILQNVVYEQKYSDFKPHFLEKEILFSLGDKILLKGFVDRVDKCGNYFRIIDYKTGKTGSIRNELFYGKKLQLFLYASAIKQKLGLDCAGVYYFDCQTKYSPRGTAKKLLNGLTLEEENVVYKSDFRLDDEDAKSDILGLSRKKTAKKGEFLFKGSVEKSLDNLMTYAQEISKIAFDEIEQGYIAGKPFSDACKNCPYLSICRHTKADGKRITLKEGKKKVEDGQD